MEDDFWILSLILYSFLTPSLPGRALHPLCLSFFLPLEFALSISETLSSPQRKRSYSKTWEKSESELSSLSVDRFPRKSLHKRYAIPKLFILIWYQKCQASKPMSSFLFFLQVIHEDTNKVPLDFYFIRINTTDLAHLYGSFPIG